MMPQLRGHSGDPKGVAFCEGGCNTHERQLFEPPMTRGRAAEIYYPKRTLKSEHPKTITRATRIRTLDHRLVRRPDGTNAMYDLKKDPQRLNHVYGGQSYALQQTALHAQVPGR